MLIPWGNFTAVVAILIVFGMIFGTITDQEDAARMGMYALIGIAVLNLAIGSFLLGPVAAIFQIAMASRRSVNDYAELFDAANWLPESPTDPAGPTAHIRRTLLSDDEDSHSASQGMRELAKIARMGGLKQTASTFLLYLPLQAFWLWDVRVLRRLEGWKSRYSSQIPEWFDALGELEALMSIAALQHDSPNWSRHSGSKRNPRSRSKVSDTRCSKTKHGSPTMSRLVRRVRCCLSPAATCRARAPCCEVLDSTSPWPWPADRCVVDT